MIIQKKPEELILIKKACSIVGATLALIKASVREGITTKELDEIAHSFIVSQGAYPSFKDYGGFPASICASINEVVVHGIPNEYVIKSGDIIGIDVGACYKGWHGDAARTFLIGEVDVETKNLVEVTKECFFEAIKQLKAGDRVGKISAAVEAHAKAHHYGIVKELVGHGVGKNLHEDPQIPNYGKENSGEYIPVNSVLAIEPMINRGTANIRLARDGWTVSTADRKPSAHYENTVLVTENGVEILTLMDEEK